MLILDSEYFIRTVSVQHTLFEESAVLVSLIFPINDVGLLLEMIIFPISKPSMH
jgi:hypothetical protein